MNIFILEKSHDDEDDYSLVMNNIENKYEIYEKNRMNIYLIKDGGEYFPIFKIIKSSKKSDHRIIKMFAFEDEIVQNFIKFYKKNIESVISGKDARYSARDIYAKYNNKYKFTKQYITNSGKVIYLSDEDGITVPCYPSGIIYSEDIEAIHHSEFENKHDANISINNILPIFGNIDISYVYDDCKENGLCNVHAIMIDNDIILKVKENYIDISGKLSTRIPNKGNRDESVTNITELLGERIMKEAYDQESYNLYRLAISDVIQNNKIIYDMIKKVLSMRTISGDETLLAMKDIIYFITNKEMHRELMKAYNMSINTFEDSDIDDVAVIVDNVYLDNYKVNNQRILCSKSDDNTHCLDGKLVIPIFHVIGYINKIIVELMMKSVRYNELMGIENSSVSKIVNNEYFDKYEGEDIIVDYITKIKKHTNKDIVESVKMINNMKIQSVKLDNLAPFRAFANGYYYMKSINRYNLGVSSHVQHEIAIMLRSRVIKWMHKYRNNMDYINKLSQESATLQINCIIELEILSILYPETVIKIYNNNYDVVKEYGNGNLEIHILISYLNGHVNDMFAIYI